jgi:hypothetical protein
MTFPYCKGYENLKCVIYKKIVHVHTFQCFDKYRESEV